MRSGRGAATCSAWTLPAQSSARRRRSRPTSAEVSAVKGESATLDAHVSALKDDLRDLTDFDSRARDLCDRLAVGLQAAALFRAASPLADAFCRSRIETKGAHNYGALTGVDTKAIVNRAAPR